MRGSELLVKMLIECNCRYIFGVPGDTIMGFLDDLYLHREEITFIRCRDERSAGFMADAYARVSGRPGVCFGPSGGGATYLLPAVAESFGSSIPLVALTGDVALMSDDRNALTTVDQYQMYQPITRWNRRVVKYEKIPAFVRKAFRMAAGDRPGAVHLSFPEDILSGQGSGIHDLYGQEEQQQKIAPAPGKIPELAAGFIAAQKPLILAGGGVHLSQAYASLKSLVQRFSLPVVTSITGKGCVEETLPGVLGVIGNNGGRPSANEAAAEADFVLVLGSRLNSTTTNGFSFFQKASLGQLDISQEQLGVNYRVKYPVVADIDTALPLLESSLADAKYKVKEDWLHQVAAWKKRELPLGDPDLSWVDPHLFLKRLEEKIPGNSIFAVDAGTPTPYMMRSFCFRESGRRILAPRHHGALGYAIPAVVGAHYANPEAKVIGVFGDGSLGMSMGELETLSYYQIPALLIHFHNCCYDWIKELQNLYYQERYYGVDFSPSFDPMMIASGSGLKAFQIKDNQDLFLLDEILALKEPVFLDVKVRRAKDQIPPVARWEKDAQKSKEERIRESY